MKLLRAIVLSLAAVMALTSFSVLCPARKARAATRPIIFIGDSRTEGMEYVLSSKQKKNTIFYAETSQGYDWFVNNVVSKVTTKLYTYPHADFRIVISLGINDHTGNISKYVNKYNELAKKEWAGYDIYIVSIAPVDEAKMKATCKYPQTNASIESSNSYIRKNLNGSNLHYINLYKKMISSTGTSLNSGFDTISDGAHYTSGSYQKIWKYLKKKVEG